MKKNPNGALSTRPFRKWFDADKRAAAKEEATMKKNPNNGAHSTGPFSKWFDADKLCGNPCVCTDAHQELANVKEAIDKNIKNIPSKLYCNPFACTDPRQELASVMEEIDKNIKSIPSDIMFYDDDSFDDSFESSSFQDSITLNSSTRKIPTPTVSQKSGETNAHTSYYVVTALPKEPTHPDKEPAQPLAETKKKKKAVMKEIKANGCANTGGDEGVELVHDGSKAYMKSIGMRKSFIPLHRKRTLRITNQMMVPQQGSGDSTMSLSSDEETYQEDEKNLFSDEFFPDQWFDFANFQQDNDEEKAKQQLTKEEVKAAKELKKKEEALAKREEALAKKEEALAKKDADAKKKAEKVKKQMKKKAQSERKAKAKKEAEAKRQSQKEAEKQMVKAQNKLRKEQKGDAQKADKKAKKSQKEMEKQMVNKAQREEKAEANRAKKEAEAKKQSENYAEKQKLKWEKYHRKEQKAEAKKAKEEAKKEEKKIKHKEAEAENRQLFSTLNWRRKRSVSDDESDDHNEICVQEVWRST